MNSDEYLEKIEKDILLIIEEKLVNGQMDADRASTIARMILEKLHPPLSLDQIYAIVPTLDDEFHELAKAVLPIQREHEEKVREVVAKHAEVLIKEGRFDEAKAILLEANKSKATSS